MDQTTRIDIEECVHFWRARKLRFNSILDWWDNLKIKMKEIFIRNGKRIQRKTQQEQRALEIELDSIIKKKDLLAAESENIRIIKNRLNEIESQKTEASRIRSKQDWIDKRENCSRYFHEEEKRKGGLKKMECLIDEAGKTVETKEEICKTAIKFYESLLTNEPIDEHKLQTEIDRHIDKRLSDEQRDSIEGPITKQEILEAIKQMKNNKSPGMDGLTREFYVMMWDLIGNDLVDVITNVYLKDNLPESWREGLITLIYKEKGDIKNLKNWRPITLLNTDYKIMTKSIANRIKKVAGRLINLDQACSLINRNIHDQLYFIRDYQHYYSEIKRTGLLVAIDQVKAFDRINHMLIFKILEKYNFGPTILGFVRTIYHKMRSCLVLNGFITAPFSVSRSVRQGDGLSMILFVLVGELLSQMLRNNMEIAPICLPNSKPKKLTQYADDVTILTDNKKALTTIMKVLGKYEKLTGAKINKEKTEILLIGPWTKTQKEKIPSQFFNQISENAKILGVYFGKNAQKLNEQMLISKIEGVIEKWEDKALSMTGKILLLRTLVVSKIWHVAKVTGLQRKFIETVNRKMASFFWYPKTFHCLNIQTLKNEITEGGLDFPDIETELQAYHLETICDALNNPEKQWVGEQS